MGKKSLVPAASFQVPSLAWKAGEPLTIRCHLADELNILALVKGAERYIFVYDDASRPSLIDTIRDLAADPQTSLSWFDANVLTRKAREQEHAEAMPVKSPLSLWERGRG